MQRGATSTILCVTVLGATHALAQPPPSPPPPPAPEQNWAPPPQQEPPAPTPAPPTTPPSETAPQPEQVSLPPPPDPGTKLEIYGFTMLDIGYTFGHVGDPAWRDVVRPTKQESFRHEFGKGGETFANVRQTRFGAKAVMPTSYGDVKTTFEFELFGTGVDAGQTTFRLRHAYGDFWQIRAGQTWSPFMDPDVFPNSIEYWGPNGMVFYRNVQLAWMPIQGDSRVTVAVERPGGSPDTGIYGERLEVQDTEPRFTMPDISAEGRYAGGWGYVELAGILRYLKWDDLTDDPPDLGGSAWGWGVNLSSNLRLDPVLLRLQAVYGEAIQNYMNDAGADIGVEATNDPARPLEPLEGVALPVLGLVAFADLEWSKRFTSSIGYSFVWVDNADGQDPSAFHIGHYALANLLWHPTEKAMLGAELQWGRRENFDDGFDTDQFRIQFSFRYNFSREFGGD
jgi:hypothetical protein